MANKDFKTIDEQLDILKSRGLTIDDEDQAKTFLLHNNYYRVSGYSLTLRNHDHFFRSATFQNIIDIYNFDHELRHMLLKYLEIIEVRFKSVYAYEFTQLHGPTGHLEANNFSNPDKHKDLINKAKMQQEKRLPHEAYLKHFIEDLQQELPFWAYVDLLTIADISIFFSISDSNVRNNVADSLGIKENPLGRFMHFMTILRNLCAHGSRLYNRLFEQKPKLKKDEQKLLNTNKYGIRDNSHLFSYILVMKRLLAANEFNEMKQELSNLTKKYPFVHMKYYGFRSDWKNIL